METSNELSKRAEDEATIIKLIFGQEVVHCKSRDCWKQFHNLELRVRLGSTTSDKDGSASIELDFNCPPTYPLEPPKITILKPIGLRVNEVFELNELLNTRIRQIAGAELIYDICVEAQNYLRSKRESTESNEQTISRPSTSSHLQPSIVSRNPARQNSVDSRQSVFLAEDEEPIEVRVEDELRIRREKWLERIGPLGDSIKVELLSKPGQLVEINRVMNSTVHRKHEYATEYYACDQQRIILVSEYKFEHKLTKRDKNLIVKLSNFEKSLRTFTSHIMNNNSVVPIDDEFLTTFAFLHVHRASNSPHLFDTRLLVGQYIDLDSRTLSVDGVLQSLLKTSKDTLLPQIANHLICGLKTLHEFRVAHGDLNLNTIWVRSDRTSDILHFCHSFGHITEEAVRRRRVSVHSLRLRDLKSLGSVLSEINERDKSSFTNQECLKDFVSQCNLSEAHVQTLSNHRFLYLSFPASPRNEDGSMSFTPNPTAALKQSGRLLKEYHVINYIGRGGFGEVFLARNKLDGNNYAIKRIPLTNVPWKQIERIKNEVALCSKITDVNIVRYFSSWLETITLDANETDVSSESVSQIISDDQSLMPSKLRNLGDQVPSYSKDEQKAIDSTNTSESSDESGPGFFRAPKTQQRKKPTTLVNMSHGSDLSVVFAGDSKNGGNVFGLSDLSEEQSSTEKSQSKSELSLTYLCLQMEYCKQETLRKLIDDNELFDNAAMTWRIFKEILLGLQCMHSYSLRISFLDSNWTVKIGDFGLATRALFHSDDDNTVVKNPNSSNALQPSMTKNIGTTLYIAPEAKESERKVYNTKFDIYSLGIVLFEMLLKPPATRIERVRILEKLRDEMVVPSETYDNLPSSHRQSAEKLLKWCLKRDPSERPTATELLDSGLIPVIESEENKFIQMYRTKQKLRPLLLHELFNTPLQPTLGNNYDRKFCTDFMNRPFPLDTIKVLSDLLRLNGYDFLHNQELIPSLQNFSFEGLNSTLLSSLCESYKVMDGRNGAILQLPTTFRYGFARFCAHRGITRLKSYSIGRVYSQSSTLNNHPESRYELEVCVRLVDIIAPHEFTTQISLDILELVVEIFKKLHLPDLKWKLVINHRSLLKAVCLHYGLVDEFTQNNFLNLLYEFSSQTRKDSYSNLLFGLTHQCGMSEKVAHDMCILLNLPVSTPHQLRERLRSLLRCKQDQVRENAERALTEYDFIFHNLSHKLPAQLNMIFLPLFCYQPLIFSDGLLFSMRVEFGDLKGKTTWIPLLSGGQYDKFLSLNRQINASSLLESNCAAFGFNFAIANAADLQCFLNKSKRKLTSSLVLVACSSLDYFAAAASMANQLREYEIPTDLWQEELNFGIGGTLLEYCLERPVQFILQFVNLDNICVYQNERFEDSNGANEFRIIQNRATVSETLKYFASQVRSTKDEAKSTDGSGVDRADLKNLPMTASMQNVNLKTCSTRASKLTHHTRKKYESHAFAVLNPLLKRFSSKCHIDAIITDLPLEVLSAIANIDRTRGHDHTFTEFQLLAKQHAKHKSDIFLLFDEMETFIEQQKFQQTCNTSFAGY
ncbi:Non-specific serine/threonine protein kinase [Aphelenchoides besseyi]|nr:Non-specific serine/threonine protein kinase [Aphelenchoides besseyi]